MPPRNGTAAAARAESADVTDGPVIDLTITLIPPGPISYDGRVYRAFKPYALLANSLTRHFRRVVVCSQAIGPDSTGFAGCDTEFSPAVQIQPLPEPPPDARRGLGYQVRRALALVRLMPEWDLVYVFVPSYPGAVAYTVGRLFMRKRMPVYLANDWEEITPYTFRGRGWKRALFPAYRWTLTQWERWIMRTAPLALTAGRALHQKYGGEGRPVYETVPVMEMRHTDMVRRDPETLGSPVRMLYVGSLIPRKGLPVLFDALLLLAQKGVHVTLDLVGEGAGRAELEALVAKLGLGDRVTFHGFVENGPALFTWYRQADLFVLPTYSEGFPRVLYEALGHSLPVVATAVSGIPRLLRDGEHALLVPAGDAAALADAIERMVTDDAARRRMVRNGYALVEPILAADPALQFVELYHRHLARGAAA
jgi:glycosyltransferase involved in cell wall biosynthesis